MRRVIIFLLVGVFAAVSGAEDDPVIGEKPLSELIKQLRSENRGLQMRASKALVEAPAELKPAIAPKVMPLLKSERENDKFVAAQVLGECGPVARPAVPDLVPMLKGTQYERNRAAAAKALGQILKDAKPDKEVEDVADALITKLNEDYDSYSDVRREAMYAIGMIGPAAKKTIPKFTKGLTDYREYSNEHQMVRRASAWACGRMGPLAAEHMDRLIAMLNGEGGDVPEIMEAIGCIGAVNENVVPNLVDKLSADTEWSPICWRLQTYEALRKFGPKAALAVPVVARLLRSGKVHYAHVPAALRVFESVGPAGKEALPVLESFKTVKEYRGGSKEWNDNPSAQQMENIRKTAKDVAEALAGQKPPAAATEDPAKKAP
ncbi:MAG: hypothetical protein C0404_08290 [Verrucomicrobia bacterium]|nr:hypothetical protein [Verrucomicrobiota bacterium]